MSELEDEESEKRALYRDLHRSNTAAFFLGVRGKGCGRGGAFPATPPPSPDVVSLRNWRDDGTRFLILNRQKHLEGVFEAEMRLGAHAEEMEPGLWRTAGPLPRLQLRSLASVRGEVVPLIGPCEDAAALVEAVRASEIAVDGWALYHERVGEHPERISSMRIALLLGGAIGGVPDIKAPRALLVLLETAGAYYLCAAAHSHADAATREACRLLHDFRYRPFNFAAALDPALAAAALNILAVGPDDLLLDPCCGTGTILMGGLERGATVRGLDLAPKFAIGTRFNLERYGFESCGGGALRTKTLYTGRCAVAQHDARESFHDLTGLGTPTVVISNLPHGRYLKLPYEGYVTDIVRNLARVAPAARYCFISGAGALHEDTGPDSIRQVMEEEGFGVYHVTDSKKLRLTFAHGPAVAAAAAAAAAAGHGADDPSTRGAAVVPAVH